MFKKIQLSILMLFSLPVIIIAAQCAEKQNIYSFTWPSSPQGGEYSSDEDNNTNNYIFPTSPQGGEYSYDEDPHTVIFPTSPQGGEYSSDELIEIADTPKTNVKVSQNKMGDHPPILNNPDILYSSPYNLFNSYPPIIHTNSFQNYPPNFHSPITSKNPLNQKNRPPYAISICSGIGATDRTLLQGGYQIIASVDMDEERNETNIENNVNSLNEKNKYKIIDGSITEQNTLQALRKTVRESSAECLGNIDLLYTFVAGGKYVDEAGIFQSIFDLVGLKKDNEKKGITPSNDLPKLIYFEVLKNSKLAKKEFSNSLNHYSKNNGYYSFMEDSFNFSDYGLPVSNFRKYYIFIRNDLCQNKNLCSLWPTPSKETNIHQALNITLPNSPYSETTGWWEEALPNGQHIPLHNLHFSDESILIQADFIKKIPGTGIKNGKLSNIPGFEIKKDSNNKRITDREGDIWRKGLNNQLQTITQSCIQPFIAIHPTQNRSLTLLELSVLQGMHTLGNFNLFSRKEMLNSANRKPQKILERISTTTPPLFLKQIFSKIKAFLSIESESLPMDLSQLSPYFYDAPINLHGEAGDKTWQKVRNEHRNKQLLLKNESMVLSNFPGMKLDSTHTNTADSISQQDQQNRNPDSHDLPSHPYKRKNEYIKHNKRPEKKANTSSDFNFQPTQPAVPNHQYTQDAWLDEARPFCSYDSMNAPWELPMQPIIPEFTYEAQNLIAHLRGQYTPLFMNVPPTNGVVRRQMNPPPPTYAPTFRLNTIDSNKESFIKLDLTNANK